MREECCTCSDRLNYVKLCEKYDQLESIHKVLVDDNLTYENQIADLEAKLAEKEKENDNLYDRLNSKAKFYEMSLEKDYKEYLSRLNKLEKQCDKDKISFAVEQLEKVKEVCVQVWGMEYAVEAIEDFIDNQIKQLKEGK